MRVGIDTILISRFEKKQKSFMQKTFTISEQEYAKTRKNLAETYAGIFACKEAFLKACEVGVLNGIKLTDIEVLHNENGAPYLNVSNQIKKQFKIKNIFVSISHDGDNATAVCVLK